MDVDKKKALYDYYKKAGYKLKVYDYPTVYAAGGKRHLREFDAEDLLFRKPLAVTDERTNDYYKGKVILITGGGGSIGSELCRQLAKMSPKKIVILDIYENGAYDVQQELKIAYGSALNLQIEICSITHKKALEKVFEKHHPQIIINAAAHKHVPLMENNCVEAIYNNVFGTRNLVELCEKYGAERFMMVSTDKAVNPTNVMGATKRMCEMIVQSASTHGKVKYSATRFGNVLGSAGSVIPLFRRQIANGGPVTVTDKRIIRYFMTIPEASQLVLQSGAMAKNGELFVLDMGKPVKIYDLAENMIRLSGVHGVQIIETGLRPGEKLYEELLVKTEELDKTENSMIFIERDTALSEEEISRRLALLQDACDTGDDDMARSFKPKKLSEDGKVEFRPLHTTDLVTQIAIVSMLHLVIYEIPLEGEKNPKLELSNLSRLIPSDFYGNRVSVQPEYLFKPWKQQYQKYNQNSNDALKKYHTSLEYKYEVTLDLKNFFPTINPIIVYYYIIGHLPAHLTDKEMSLMKKILQKLLFCRLSSNFDKKEFELKEQYYKVTKCPESCEHENVQGKADNAQKQSEEKCPNDEKLSGSYKFVRGIPQGLPQSYFFGNIYMISVSEIFRKQFNGASYFYVDDSVIFTNDVEEEGAFKRQLVNINKRMKAAVDKILEDHKQENYKIYPKGTEEFYEGNLYGVEVHLEGKSNYARLDSLDESEVYLKCISREMSQAGSDFFRMYSDEENRNLEEKFAILAKQVKAKRDQLSGQEEKQEEKVKNDTKKFKERLTRYYRFFEYRRQKLAAMHQPENGSDEAYKEQLREIIYAEFSKGDEEDLCKIQDKNLRSREKDKKILQKFMNSYTADIWDAAVGMYQTFADDRELKALRKYVSKLNELCYGKAAADFSYLKQTYRELLKTTKKTEHNKTAEKYLRIQYDDPYKTLKYLAKYEINGLDNNTYNNGDLKSDKSGLENREGVLIPKTITEKIILEIPVDISQMSVFECKKPCQKVRIDRENISKQEITLICGEECEDRNNSKAERRCNFLCQWFCVKNDYLIRELAALKEYLKRNQNNYFQCEIEIRIKCNEKTSIDVRQFEVLKNYIQKKNING